MTQEQREHMEAMLIDAEELTADEAWELVEKAIRNSPGHAAEEFEKLPPLVRKIVKEPRYLYE